MSVRKFLSGIRFDAGQKEGRIIFRLVNSLFFVSLISLMTVLVGSILDGLIISNFLRETAFAAFGLSSPLTNLVELMGHVVATGCVVTCGNLIGAGDGWIMSILLAIAGSCLVVWIARKLAR